MLQLSFITFLERLLRKNHIVNEEDYPSKPPAVKADEPLKPKADKALIQKLVLSCTVNENNVTVEVSKGPIDKIPPLHIWVGVACLICVLQLPSKEIADGLAKLVTAKFLRRTLVFEPVLHSEEDDDSMYDMSTLNESVDFIDNMDTGERIDSDVTVDKYVATDSKLDMNDNVNVSHYYIYVDNVPEYNQVNLKLII